ncbi:site-specific integrase [Bacteroides heparinolyticus]|uniref:site-specific integrase n=1 Tax=Prevotella heparinolytica TaxID=28113 RepID=UPI003FA0395E
MNKITYRLVYNRKKRLNRQGMALVQVEAYLKNKKKYFSTGVYLKPEQWDTARCVVKKHPNADALNRWIQQYATEIEKKELDMWRQGKRISLESLKDGLSGNSNSASFLHFFKQEVENSMLKNSSKSNHLSTLALLGEFKKDLCFADLTFEFITSFECFLRSKGYHINTIAKHMKHLKRQVNIAINKDYMEMREYAFRKYKIKTVANKHTHLTPEELERLEYLPLMGKAAKYRKTLDAFLFCCYTGIRYSDFINLSSDNIVEIYRETWLVYRTVKTDTEVRLPLFLLFDGKALGILDKYKDAPDCFYQLKNNSNVNKELIMLARLANLGKRISFHTARHTNATLLIYKGVNITTVQKLLGHKNLKTTQVYADVMDMTIVQDLKKNSEPPIKESGRCTHNK